MVQKGVISLAGNSDRRNCMQARGSLRKALPPRADPKHITDGAPDYFVLQGPQLAIRPLSGKSTHLVRVVVRTPYIPAADFPFLPNEIGNNNALIEFVICFVFLLGSSNLL
jgi:hypothetical protein